MKPLLQCTSTLQRLVAPRVGAWIETQNTCLIPRLHPVAPRVGAWIETQNRNLCRCLHASHPVWVRGLKQTISAIPLKDTQSHPVWVRGLKRVLFLAFRSLCPSHPVWVRGLKLRSPLQFPRANHVAPRVGAWIETFRILCTKQEGMSHPVWVRGLKR